MARERLSARLSARLTPRGVMYAMYAMRSFAAPHPRVRFSTPFRFQAPHRNAIFMRPCAGHAQAIARVLRMTGAIHGGAFDLTTTDHRKVKRIGALTNPRDSMTNMELALTALGEETARLLHQAHDSQSFDELHDDARDAREVGGAARQGAFLPLVLFWLTPFEQMFYNDAQYPAFTDI